MIYRLAIPPQLDAPVAPSGMTIHVVRHEADVDAHPAIADNLRGQNLEYLEGIRRGEAVGVFIVLADELAHWAFLMIGSRTSCLLGIGRDTALLGNAYTDPGFRGRGLQTLSLRQRLHECQRLGIEEVFTETEPENVPSRRAMERVGMSLVREVTLVVLLNRVVLRRSRQGSAAPRAGIC